MSQRRIVRCFVRMFRQNVSSILTHQDGHLAYFTSQVFSQDMFWSLSTWGIERCCDWTLPCLSFVVCRGRAVKYINNFPSFSRFLLESSFTPSISLFVMAVDNCLLCCRFRRCSPCHRRFFVFVRTVDALGAVVTVFVVVVDDFVLAVNVFVILLCVFVVRFADFAVILGVFWRDLANRRSKQYFYLSLSVVQAHRLTEICSRWFMDIIDMTVGPFALVYILGRRSVRFA